MRQELLKAADQILDQAWEVNVAENPAQDSGK
jgi:hypothetical protein